MGAVISLDPSFGVSCRLHRLRVIRDKHFE